MSKNLKNINIPGYGDIDVAQISTGELAKYNPEQEHKDKLYIASDTNNILYNNQQLGVPTYKATEVFFDRIGHYKIIKIDNLDFDNLPAIFYVKDCIEHYSEVDDHLGDVIVIPIINETETYAIAMRAPDYSPYIEVAKWIKCIYSEDDPIPYFSAYSNYSHFGFSKIATLDESGKIPSSQLPSYVDDVEEHSTKDSLPETGESGKIYVTTDDNKTYRWSGSTYIEIGNPLSSSELAKNADLTAEVTRATAAEGAIQTALDNHKVDADKKHIPTGGHERQILAWQADGTAKWDDIANMFTGLEELLAYGVEWKDNVADPHLTRIGNMSLHKTLPIQSQLKGCIAQKDKIIYWLAEDDWRFRKDPIYMTVDLSNNVEHPNFGDASITTLAVGQFVKAGTHIGKITFIEGTSVTVEWQEDLGNISAELTTITKLEIGSRLDGYDGTVRVYCPNFYIKSQIIGNTRRVWLSTVKIDNTWTYQHEILIDAYRSTILNAVPKNMGYLSTLPVNSAISVVNTATYCRGGDNIASYDKYLTGANGTEIDIFRTDLGKPRTYQSRATWRTATKNAGNAMMNYDQYKNIFYWLYVVEYANFNCQEAYNEVLTDDGYHQGGLGNGVTNVSNWGNFNGWRPITPCGYGNDMGNGTGVKLITSPGLFPANGVYMCRWRGFDNPFGDIYTNLDGIIIDADADNHPNNMNYVYTCQDPDKYADSLNDGYEKVGEEIPRSGYTKLFDLGDAAHIIPNVMGGNTTQYKCDYHQVDTKNITLRTLYVGGCADNSAYAGLGLFYSPHGVSRSDTGCGFRSVSAFVSFSE